MEFYNGSFRSLWGKSPNHSVYLAPLSGISLGIPVLTLKFFCSSLYRNTWTGRFYKETFPKTSNADKVDSFQPLFVMKQSECDIYLRLSLSAVSLSLLQLPLYHESKFKTIAFSVDNSINSG